MGTGRCKQVAICCATLLSLAFAVSAHAVEQSRFHLLSLKCEPEGSDGPEPTPQSPPLVVDDPGTPGCNRWEINVVVSNDNTQSQTNWELPLLDINYGIGDNIQLKYEIPFMSNVSQDSSLSALGESQAGIKYMFFEEEASETQLAIYPQSTFVQSNADVVTKGMASPGSIVTLPVLLSTTIGHTALGKLSLTGNLGYNLSTKADTANFLSAALGVGTPILRNVSLMGELETEQATSRIDDASRAQLLRADLGAMTTISKNFILFGAVGHSLVASDTFEHTYVLAGIQLLAGSGAAHEDRVAEK